MCSAVALTLVIMMVPGTARAALCPDFPALPILNTAIDEAPINFVAVMTRKDLAKMEEAELGVQGGTPKLTAPDGQVTYHSFVGGLMRGTLSLHHNVQFGVATNKATGYSCAWITQIDVRLHMEPSIYVAKDLQQKDCWHREVYAHELKHVDADRALLQKYAVLMTDGLGMAFAKPQDYMTAELPPDDHKARQDVMRELAARPLGVLFNAMLAERPDRHKAVDAPDEIARVMKTCKGTALPGWHLIKGFFEAKSGE